ncbi:unnamed protein product [Effrenium voratum]|nr:unnamed protein product [Effrenium voratum]|mmetsp:Transcript_105084/g.250146  ORF Transcript_105084/g.250146 Transcript_105084/m.250146 type:complete len:904 (+) Transcript_105084:109-2820(+)
MQAHEEKVEERKLHGVRGKLRRALRASNPEDQRVIYATGRVAAESWSEEVVRALGSRMPGGLSNVTVPCKFCASIFYPCLCVGGVRDVPHRRGLVAPRIAHEAEVRRLHNQPMGHLRELATSLDMCGMDKDILHVSGPAEPDLPAELPLEAFSDTTIVWREGDTYVVNRNTHPITQKLGFTESELRNLQGVLVERDKHITVRERWEGRQVKPSYVTYLQLDQAFKDVQISRVRTSHQDYWEVCQVKSGGLADTAGMVPGQRVTKICIALVEPQLMHRLQKGEGELDAMDCARWEYIDLVDDSNIPKCFLDWGFKAADASKAAASYFPCRLEFDLVAPGSRLIRAADAAAPEEAEWEDIDTDGDVLKKIFKHTSRRATGDKTAQCKLWFERDQRERVTRSAAAVRHKHCTEKDVAGGPDVDLELFHTWLSSKNLSPSHSKFVFRRLLGSVRQELANFERKRTYRLETMLSKSIRCVDLMEREKKLKSERESGPLLKRRLAEIKMEVDVCEQEIAYLFDQVPPSFLEDITDLADTMKQTLPADMSTTDCAVDSRQSRSLPKSMILNVVSWQDAKKTLTEKVGDAMPDSDKKRLKEAFNHLAEKASTYKEQLRGRGKKRSADAYDDMVSQEDGRLSEKEFARVILLSGVNWLGMDEIQFLFSSMDKDKSGKLNLGELLCTAMRVIDLSDRLQRFVDDNKDLSQANCLLEFGHLLKMGSDLVGPKSHPLVPDSRISASSYFLNDAEHGFQQMWRSRLDCQDTCWVGESHDKDEHPWIQWRFSSPCKIQAISTKGRPDSDAWVIKYRVEYVTHALLDDDDDDEKELSDTLKWESYSEEDGKIFHFDGNADRHTRKDSFLRYPFVTSAVRLFPLEYRGRYPAMRASLYGSFTHLSAHDLALDQTKQPED